MLHELGRRFARVYTTTVSRLDDEPSTSQKGSGSSTLAVRQLANMLEALETIETIEAHIRAPKPLAIE